MGNYTRFSLEDRIIIQEQLAVNTSFKKIAAMLDKHPSSISREIQNHMVHEEKGAIRQNYNSCKHRFSCSKNHVCQPCHSEKRYKKCKNCKLCNHFCPDFEKQSCERITKSPYVCNGCGKIYNCTLKKQFYRASTADSQYRELLSESRKGIPYTEQELKHLNDTISPLIKQGQSPHHICITNPDTVMISERTIYRLIDNGCFSAINLDLPRKVRFKPRHNKPHKKVDKKCRINRTYQDFQVYMEQNPDTLLVELDSVEGIKGEKVLLTIHFVKCEMMLAFIRDSNDSLSVIQIFDRLYEILGLERFSKLFPICLTDNGSEFSNPARLEYSTDNEQRTQVFYCDPNRSDQKGSAERNHEFIRCFVPKGKSFDAYTQDDIQLMMDHINSYHRDSLGGRSAYEMFEFMYGEGILKDLKCHMIPAKEVTLKNTVFRKEVR